MDKLLTQTTVLSRPGWSKALLTNLLGEPDLRKKVFGRPTLACLYQEARVVQAEQTAAFHAAQDGQAKRKAAADKGVRGNTDKRLAAVFTGTSTVGNLSIAQLKHRAVDAYNQRHWDSDFPASRDSDTAFLDRICVSFIRHELTEYDASLEIAAGKVGVRTAVEEIRAKVYAAIGAAYPLFADEGDQQRDLR